MAQMHKVQMAHHKLEMTSQKTSHMTGAHPHQRLHINIDNDEWIVFNKEYYKLREMEYYAMYKIPEPSPSEARSPVSATPTSSVPSKSTGPRSPTRTNTRLSSTTRLSSSRLPSRPST